MLYVGCCWRILHTGNYASGTLGLTVREWVPEWPYALRYRYEGYDAEAYFLQETKKHVNPCYCHCFLGLGVQNKANVLLKHPNPNKWFTFVKKANDTKRWLFFVSISHSAND